MKDNPKLKGKKGLFIAEKPDAMKEFQRFFRLHQNEFSFFLDFDTAAGMVTRLKEPKEMNPNWEKWTLAELPMLPDANKGEWDFVPSKGNNFYKKLKERLENGNYDFIVSGADPDRMGSLINESVIYTMSSKVQALPRYRFWNSDMSEKNIVDTFHNLYEYNEVIPRTGSEANLAEAEELRSRMDFLVGLNSTRLLTLKSGTKIRSGRVNTAAMKILYVREVEIRDFVSKTYYTVRVEFTHKNGKYIGTLVDEDNSPIQFENESDAKSMIEKSANSGDCVIKSLKKTKVNERQPGLYSTAKLQSDMSKVFGIPLGESMEAIDKNYKSKISSYPRTESAVISTELFADILPVLKAAKELDEFKDLPEPTEEQIAMFGKNKSYVDDKKLSSHTAIVPTPWNPNSKINFSIMSDAEKSAFYLTARSVVLGFEPVAIKEKTEIITEVGGLKFKTNGSVVIQEGWQRLVPELKNNSNELPKVEKGDKVSISGDDVYKGKTKPKPRYNASTLIEIMENVYKLVEDEDERLLLKKGTSSTTAGIGSPATRSTIVENLLENKYITQKGKQSEYTVTELGMQLLDQVGDTPLASPLTTAHFEALFEEVSLGKVSGAVAYDKIVDFTKKLMIELGGLDFTNIQHNNPDVVGILSENNPVKEGKNGFYDAKYLLFLTELTKAKEEGTDIPKQYGFYVKKKMDTPKAKMKGSFTAKDIKKFIAGEKVTKEISFSGKALQKVEFVMNEDKTGVRFAGGNSSGSSKVEKTEKKIGKWNLEQITVTKEDNTSYSYYVVDGDTNKRFYSTMYSVVLSDDQINSLLSGKAISSDNWKSSKGDTFSADVSLDPDTFKVSTKFKNKNDFIFNENGKSVKHINFTNKGKTFDFYVINDEFNVSLEYSKHKLTNNELIELAKSGRVHIETFISGAGNMYSASLVLENKKAVLEFDKR